MTSFTHSVLLLSILLFSFKRQNLYFTGMIWRKEGGYKAPNFLVMDVQSDRMTNSSFVVSTNGYNGSCLDLLKDFERIHRKDMPVLFVSGSSKVPQHWIDNHLQNRMHQFLQKPFTHLQLIKNVNRFVKRLNNGNGGSGSGSSSEE